ncbi:alpha/beta fold hydrolase [Paenibacillus macerans]|uniref:alpha/beta fold hydrolase n=1 Tax=Paenibacillus macerans TaxID=44252 RepID=UPI003D31B1A8
MPFCKVREAEIYYEEVGTGRPILMIHGFTVDHRLMSGCMEPVFRERPGWRRIYVDLPGMGRSRGYEGIADTDGMLEAILDFIEERIPDSPFLLAGESYGGYLARGIIARRPELVEGAAFICPMIVPEHDDRTLPVHTILHEEAELASTLSAEEYEDFRSMGVILDRYTWTRYANEVVPGCSIANESFLNGIRKRYGFTFPIDQAEFPGPSLFLLGRQDASVGYADALRLLELYPRGSFVVLDKAGHNLQFEREDLFNALINEWLDRIEG